MAGLIVTYFWVLIHLVPALFSFIALAKLDIAFYQFVRFAISIPAIIIAIYAFWNVGGWSIWGIIFLGIAAVFNPITRSYAAREEWRPINIAVGLGFIIHLAYYFWR